MRMTHRNKIMIVVALLVALAVIAPFANSFVIKLLARGLVLAILGAAAGLLLAFLSTRWMRSLLFEVQATDPSTYAAVAAVLVAVAVFASYLPARRAAQTDPQLALRGEG